MKKPSPNKESGVINKIEKPEPRLDSSDTEIELLKVLYENRMDGLRFLSERSFKATLQAVTLNVIVLGGLIASKVILLSWARILGSILLIVFNALVANYIYFKGRSYGKAKGDLANIETILIGKCPSLKDKVKVKSTGRLSFWSGTGIFIIAVIISCSCTVAALWTELAISAERTTTEKLGAALSHL